MENIDAIVYFISIRSWREHMYLYKQDLWIHWYLQQSYKIIIYRQISNIRRTLVDNKMVDHSDVFRTSLNYIFIIDLTSGFGGLGKDNSNTRRETFKFSDLMRLILEIWRYVYKYGKTVFGIVCFLDRFVYLNKRLDVDRFKQASPFLNWELPSQTN